MTLPLAVIAAFALAAAALVAAAVLDAPLLAVAGVALAVAARVAWEASTRDARRFLALVALVVAVAFVAALLAG